MSKGNATQQIAVLGAIGKGYSSIENLANHLPIERHKVVKAAGKLLIRGLVERVETGVYNLTQEGKKTLECGLVLNSGPRGKRTLRPGLRNTFRQRAWNAIRLIKRFTVSEIAMLAASDKAKSPESNLYKYLKLLKQQGIVVELPLRADDGIPTSNGLKTWRLVKDLGDIAPYAGRDGEFKNPNSGGVS